MVGMERRQRGSQVVMGTGVVAIHKDIAPDFFPMETRWDYLDNRFSFGSVWAYAAAYWPFVVEVCTLAL